MRPTHEPVKIRLTEGDPAVAGACFGGFQPRRGRPSGPSGLGTA